MAPPEHPFPVSELEHKVHGHTVNYKEKSRKLPKGFDLKKDCQLMELVQYSCSTEIQQMERALADGSGIPRIECFPIVRLFRKYVLSTYAPKMDDILICSRCVKGGKVFHVETTAWEGDLAWKPPAKQHDGKSAGIQAGEASSTGYWSSLWSKK
jgi:hypothetical protein